jgi:hypothetical protein
METHQKTEHPGNEDKELEVVIHTPLGDWQTSFAKTVKVEEVLAAVLNHFPDLSKNGNYQLSLDTKPITVLARIRTLVSYGIKDGTEIDLTDLGDAV